jgi:hypothetical protein
MIGTPTNKTQRFHVAGVEKKKTNTYVSLENLKKETTWHR